LRRIEGLAALAPRYDAVFCDVWGVLHNGLAVHGEAAEALRRFRSLGKRVVLITNAPRPQGPIVEQLRALGAPDDAYDAVVTSGDVTRGLLAARPGARVFHLGPERDLSLYDGLDLSFAGEADADLVSATGLFDEFAETPEDYRDLFLRLVERSLPMVCANPDLVVERGDRLLWCAGALAELYESLGGRVTVAGKPHAPIYEAALNAAGSPERSRVLAIGDGLPTDVAGAARAGIDFLFVTGGIHAADFGALHAPDADSVRRRLETDGLTAIGFLPRLVWA